MPKTIIVPTEHGEIRYELASFGSRAVARIIDVAIIFIPAMIIPLIPPWLYFALQHSGKSQATVGQKAMGLKLIDIHDRKIGFGQATGRFFGNILNVLTFGGGFLMFFFNDYNQCLHDYITNCVVVIDQPIEVDNDDFLLDLYEET